MRSSNFAKSFSRLMKNKANNARVSRDIEVKKKATTEAEVKAHNVTINRYDWGAAHMPAHRRRKLERRINRRLPH